MSLAREFLIEVRNSYFRSLRGEEKLWKVIWFWGVFLYVGSIAFGMYATSYFGFIKTLIGYDPSDLDNKTIISDLILIPLGMIGASGLVLLIIYPFVFGFSLFKCAKNVDFFKLDKVSAQLNQQQPTPNLPDVSKLNFQLWKIFNYVTGIHFLDFRKNHFLVEKSAAILALFVLTNCVGVGVFHKSQTVCNYEESWMPSETMGGKIPIGKPKSLKAVCSGNISYPWYTMKITKEEFIKKNSNLERIEKISDDEEKLIYKKDLGWSGINLMLGIPIPIGVPTYTKYEYLYFKDGVLFKKESDYSKLYGFWCGFNSGISNDKPNKVEWFKCVAKLK